MVKKILGRIAIKIADNKATGKGRFALDMTNESLSLFDIVMNYRIILVKYIFMYILLLLSTLIILPSVVFYFTTFGLSVLMFFIGISGLFYMTFKIVKTLPMMVKNEVVTRTNRINDSYQNNFKK